MAEGGGTVETLTRRERQIAHAYAGGRTYKAIAAALGVAPATIRTHLGTIYRKLGVSTKIDLLRALGEIATSEPVSPRPAEPPPGGRRQVSILCARVADPDGALAALDPEEAAAVFARFRATVAEQARRHGGATIDGAGAEGVACFGLDRADETDAEQAVRCAIDIGRALLRAGGELDSRLAPQVGVWSGTVAHGSTAAEAAGAAIHQAGQLAAAATEPAGTSVVVCPRTRAILGDFFAFLPLQPEASRARAEAAAFAVEGPREAPSRFDALHGFRLSPFVGRQREVGLLEALYGHAEEGEGQIVLLSGEPGIGKSRCVRAFSDLIDVAEADLIVFQCSPHEQASPLHAVAMTLRAMAGLGRETAPEIVRAAADRLFSTISGGSEAECTALARLFALQGEAGRSERVTAEELRSATLALLDRFLAARAMPGPLVAVFEDVHWADPMTLSWLGRIARHVGTLPALVILTARPEFRFEADAPSLTHLALARLPRRDATALAAAQLSPGADERVIARILERAEGIPLYIEEIARAHLELGQKLDDIPATLAASLAARLDRLGPAREIAQVASVIGRAFDLSLLAAMVPHGPKALQKALERLIEARLVVARAGEASGGYQFRHALIRDAAYESLLRGRRAALHLSLAEALIARAEGGEAIAPELIAEHLVVGGDSARSVPRWTEAAHAALGQGAEAEASAFCRSGLAAAEQIRDRTDRDRAICDLLLLQQRADYGRADIPHLLDLNQRAEACARRLDDTGRLVEALHARCYNLASIGRAEEALRVAAECTTLSHTLEDPEAWVMPTVMLGRAQFACGHFGPALAAFDEVRAALGEDVPRGSVFGGSLNQTLASRVWSAFALAEMGRMSAAHDAVKECDGLLPQVSMNRQDALWVALAAGRIAALLENPEEVVGRLAPFAEMCETEFPVYLGRLAMSLGPARVMLGAVDEGLDMLDRAAEVADRKRFLFLRGLLHAEHAHALTLAGLPAAATEAARGAVAEAERCGDAGSLAWARLRHAEACAAMGDSGAARVARAAVECARAGGMRPVLDRCAALLR